MKLSRAASPVQFLDEQVTPRNKTYKNEHKPNKNTNKHQCTSIFSYIHVFLTLYFYWFSVNTGRREKRVVDTGLWSFSVKSCLACLLLHKMTPPSSLLLWSVGFVPSPRNGFYTDMRLLLTQCFQLFDLHEVRQTLLIPEGSCHSSKHTANI